MRWVKKAGFSLLHLHIPMNNDFTFSQTDIKLLYGTHFLSLGKGGGLVPLEKVKAQQEELPPVTQKEETPPIVPVVAPEPKEQSISQVIETVVTPPQSLDTPATLPAIFTSGTAITWKQKPASKILLILKEADFKNQLLTGALRLLVEGEQIPVSMIGFGVFQDNAASWNVEDMPQKLGFFFGNTSLEIGECITWADKKLFVFPEVGTLALNPTLQLPLKNRLKEVQQMFV